MKEGKGEVVFGVEEGLPDSPFTSFGYRCNSCGVPTF